MKCDHNIINSERTQSILWRKISKVFYNDENQTICSLCILRELSKVDNEIGRRAKIVYDAYDGLKKAESKFKNVLFNDQEQEDENYVKGPIEFLELDKSEESLPF